MRDDEEPPPILSFDADELTKWSLYKAFVPEFLATFLFLAPLFWLSSATRFSPILRLVATTVESSESSASPGLLMAWSPSFIPIRLISFLMKSKQKIRKFYCQIWFYSWRGACRHRTSTLVLHWTSTVVLQRPVFKAASDRKRLPFRIMGLQWFWRKRWSSQLQSCLFIGSDRQAKSREVYETSWVKWFDDVNDNINFVHWIKSTTVTVVTTKVLDRTSNDMKAAKSFNREKEEVS